MELNWTTFLLEIINFLVLVWILKRFLYKPVLGVITQRRRDIEGQLSEARHLNEEAVGLKRQYQERLSDWEKERQKNREALRQELAGERMLQLEALQDELQRERESTRQADEHRRQEMMREIEHQALQQSAAFATRLLSLACGSELEERLVAMVIEEIETMEVKQARSIKEQIGQLSEAIQISSAYVLEERQRQRLEAALIQLTGHSPGVEYTQIPELLAGVKITIGAWVLQANARDELKGFTEFARAAR